MTLNTINTKKLSKIASNPMRTIRIAKLTLNVGAGKEQQKLEKGVALLKHIVGIAPVKTVTKKRIPTWGLRPGLPIGCKITLRGKEAEALFKRLLHAKEKTLKASQFDNAGNVSFGLPDYIDIEGVEYNPAIGSAGFEACVTIERPGYRVKRRRLQSSPVGKKHALTKEETQAFLTERYGVKIVEAER